MYKKSTITLYLLLLSFVGYSQEGIGIGTINVEPDAILEIESSSANKGVLIPRMNTAQRTSGWAKSQGLIIYDVDFNAFFYYTGTNWLQLVQSPMQANLDLSNNRIVNLESGVDDNDATNKGQVKQWIQESQQVVLGGAVWDDGTKRTEIPQIGNWTVNRTSLGVYYINHDLNFEGLLVMAIPDFPDHTTAYDLWNMSETSFRITVRNHDNNIVDGGFSFIAIKP